MLMMNETQTIKKVVQKGKKILKLPQKLFGKRKYIDFTTQKPPKGISYFY